MMGRFWQRRWAGVVVAAAVLLTASLARAQEKESTVPEQPLVIVNVASVERLLKGADTAFESAGRPELSETIGGVLANVNDLKGLQREASMGLFVYLEGILPQAVGFVPVENVDDLIKTLEQAPVTPTIKKTGDTTYEVSGPRQTVYVKVQEKYAFVSNVETALDRTFPNPATVTARLSSAYDIAATVNLKSLDESTKEIFLTFIRAQTETEMQQRDNEPDSAYRIRRAGAESNLELAEQIVTQAEQITLGWGVSHEQKNAGVELVVVANPGTELAKICNELNGAKTIFANLLAEKSPLTLSAAWKLSKKGKRFFEEVVAVSEAEVKKNLGGENGDEGPIIDLFKVLKDTASTGEIDAAVRFVGEPPGPFALVGGVKVADGDLVGQALSQIVPRLKDNQGLTVQADIDSYKGVSLHRIEPKEVRPQDERIYGGKPSVYFGAAGRIVWFAVGGEGAVPALKKAIDEVEKPVSDTVNAVPFQFVVNLASWMDVIDRSNNPNGFGARARTAFSKGGDSLRIDARSIDNGLRFRLQFDEAFIRLIGGEVARRIDGGQE
jgi:hypothetical protein